MLARCRTPAGPAAGPARSAPATAAAAAAALHAPPRCSPGAARRRWPSPGGRAPRPAIVVVATAALPPPLADPSLLLRAALEQPHPGLAAGALANTLVFAAGARVLLAGLTPQGMLHSWALGALSWAAFGRGGYALVCLYFLAGSAVTRLGLARKQAEGTAEARGGRRGPGSVWGSGAAGAACAAAALLLALPPASPAAAAPALLLPLLPDRLAALASDPAFWRAGFVASFASKLADTASSEVGKAYGRTTYLATTFRRVPRGTEGAVSAEGTAAGALAALAFAAAALGAGQLASWPEAGVVVAAATLANAFESVLGASAQGRVAWLTNDAVNVLQISVAAVCALALRAALL
jgi:uncharacterized membrane protein